MKLLSGFLIFLTTLGGISFAAEVNVYSTRQEYLMRPFLKEFEKRTDVKVRIVYMKKGMLERLRSEGRNTPADLVLTVDIANLNKIAQEGILQPYKSSIVDKNIPAEFRDPEGLWTALTARARIFYYSKDRVKPSELSTYEALADPKYKGKICSRSGQHDYNLALVSSLIAYHGEKFTFNWARGLLANLASKPKGNDRAQVKAISEGVCDISIGNTYYMGKMLENQKQRSWASSVNIFFPNQDGRGTHINISGGALTRGSKNKKNAVKLLEFLTEDLAQGMYAQVNHEYPLKKGVTYSAIVKGFGAGQPGVKEGRFKWDKINLKKVAANRTRAIKLLQHAKFP